MADKKITFIVESNQDSYSGNGSLAPNPKLFPEGFSTAKKEYDSLAEALTAYNQTPDAGEKSLWVKCAEYGECSVVLMDSNMPRGYSHVWDIWTNEEDLSKFDEQTKKFVMSPEFEGVYKDVQRFVNHDEMYTQKTFFIEHTGTPNREAYVSVQANGPGKNIDCAFYDKDMLLLYKEQMPFNAKTLTADMFKEIFHGTLMQEKDIYNLHVVDNERFKECAKEAYQENAINKLGIDDEFLDELKNSGWNIEFYDSARTNEYSVAISRKDSKDNLMFFCDSYESLLENTKAKSEKIAMGDFPNATDPGEIRGKYSELGKLAGECLKEEKSFRTRFQRLMYNVPSSSRNVQSEQKAHKNEVSID